MYEYDAPLAERRAAALALDRDLLRELLGAEELRELIDADVLADLELELQRRTPERRARDADEVHDLLRLLGPLRRAEIDLRAAGDPSAWIDTLLHELRAIPVVVAGDERVAAAEDAARLRDALGAALPKGLPTVFTDPVDDPLGDLVERYARTHGPFLTAEVASRFGLDPARVLPSLERLARAGRLVQGEFRPGGVQREWCDDDVLRQLRRRSLAALRREIEPVDAAALGRFLPSWQGVGANRRGLDALVETIGVLQGAAIPASAIEADVLPARVVGYRSADLDALCTAGEVVWIGAGSIGPADGRLALYFRDQVALLAPDPADAPDDPLHGALLEHLSTRGASFWPDLVTASADAALAYDDPTVLAALWDLVWAGHVTNDSLAPVRAHASTRPRRTSSVKRRPRPGRLSRLGPPAGAGRWSLVASLVVPRPDATARAQPGPFSCSTATACSRVSRLLPRASPAASPGSIPCSKRSRRAARLVAATSLPASARPSSRCRAPSTACAPPTVTTRRRSCSRQPTRGRRTAPPSHGPTLARSRVPLVPRGRSSCFTAGCRWRTSSVGGAR